jgi:predicted nucleotidyltransferase
MTKDVDCISTVSPWVLQEKQLAEMCSRDLLMPDVDVQCRYHICGTDVDVDILSPEGFNVGGVNPWFVRAAARARPYDAGEGRTVMAVTPPYFLTTKLVAFADRGPDAQSSKDAEDIVVLAVEVFDLAAQVDAEGLRADVAALWARALDKHHVTVTDLPDLVDWHLDRRDAEHRTRVAATLTSLVRG